jgi:hypothetical protein
MSTLTSAAAPYRLVVAAGPAVPAEVVGDAVARTVRDGTPVAVVIPAVLPASLPLWAAPQRLLDRVSRQRRAARERMELLGLPGTVDVVPCRSVTAAIASLCSERPPAEIVVAGAASWRLRRTLRAIGSG